MTEPQEKDSQGKCSCKMNSCYKRVKRGVSFVFSRYGAVVARYPLPFIILPIVIFGGLGAGLLAMDPETDLEKVYFPTNSRAMQERQIVRDTFPDLDSQAYNYFSQSDLEEAVSLMFFSKNGSSVLGAAALAEISAIINTIKNISVSVAGATVTHNNTCARSASQCVIDGAYVTTVPFQAALAAGSVTYPTWSAFGITLDLSSAVSSAITNAGVLVSASILKISFKMAELQPEWQEKFEAVARSLDPSFTRVTYETPDSLDEELDKSTQGDITLFAATIALCCTYASVVTTGGNPVSTRGMLAFGGILAAGLGIVGSLGLLSVCGVRFVNIVGVIPFLIIGIGIDDMFLVMSAWSETLGDVEMKLPSRVGATLATAGIGITITSLTDFLAFMIGSTSVFLSVTNFSLYAGVAVLFCYIANITLFTGCLALHGRRVYSSRHFLTCKKAVSREELLSEGRSSCAALLCGGTIPDKKGGDESLCERLPSMFLPKVFANKPICIVIIVLFMGYLAVAIYGAIHLKQGLLLKNLVQESSYYYDFVVAIYEHFPLSLPIGFIVNGPVNYSGTEGQQLIDLLSEARQDPQIIPSFQRCWLTSYLNSTYYNSAMPADFVTSLNNYIAVTPDFQADVVFDKNLTQVSASRCFVMSEKTNDTYSQAEMMERLRHVADGSSLPVFVYHPTFVPFEQFLSILPATLQLVGYAVAAITVVTFILLPHLLMTSLVLLTILMILTGIFGFMYYWDITLSAITMIHLVMSVGFSVDFSAHVCAAYLVSDSVPRCARAEDAIKHAAAPIMNGGMSTLVGIVFLAGSSSYIFLTFFQIMLLVILLGILHAVLFLPAVLALIGPQNVVSKASQAIPKEGNAIIAISHIKLEEKL